MVDSEAVPEPRGFLAAFRYSNYRYLWGSALGVSTAISMELVVMGWLVLELTDSPSLVGLMAACRFVGMLLGPFFGTILDRFDQRRILLTIRAVGVVYTITLAALYYTSLLEVWHVFILAICGGIVRGFDQTTTHTIAAGTVEKQNLASAVGMLVVGMSTTRMIAPLAGGYLYEQIGAGGCFAVMSAAYLFAFSLFSPIHLVAKEKSEYQEPVWESVAGGFRYIVNDRAISAIMILAAIANLFAFPCIMGIMPVFARDVLGVGASGLGRLISAEGLGGLIGAFVISMLGRFKHKGWLNIATMIIWPTLLGFFASSRLFYVALALLVIAGIARGIAMASGQVLLLTWSPAEIRGRVMGLRQFAVAPMLLGNLLSGAGAELWGAATVITANALSCMFTAIVTVLWAPQLHRRQ